MRLITVREPDRGNPLQRAVRERRMIRGSERYNLGTVNHNPWVFSRTLTTSSCVGWRPGTLPKPNHSNHIFYMDIRRVAP